VKKTPAEIVVRVLTEQFGCDSEHITRETKLRADLGVDSLDDVEIVMALEEEFEQEFPDDEVEKILGGDAMQDVTVGQVIDYVAGKTGTH
jgi:acyl carrier protein